ncbi:lipopolysaccharide biosynthesis protein, partial [Clostridium perfringens]
DTILISLFSTLKETAVYSNYMMIINNISVLLNSVLGSIKPTIGNLIAEESKENSYLVFRKLYLLDHLIAIFITIVTFTVINKFIIFWVGDNFLFSNTVVFVLIINLYIQISRGTVERFKDSFGIFWDVKAPVIESIMNLIFSIIMAYKFGIIGVFVGTIISNIFIVKIWKPYILFKEGFEINIKKYILQTIN